MERVFKWAIVGGIASGFAASFSKASTSVNELESKIRDTASELKKIDKSIKNTEDEINDLNEIFKSGTMDVDKYRAAQEKLSNTLKKQKSTREQLNSRLGNQKISKDKVIDARASYTESENKKRNLRSGMMDAAENAMMLALPINEAIKFESSMADVRKVVDFDTPDQFKQMGKDVLNLSKVIPMAANGLADIVAAGGQGGVGKEELLEYAESAAKMGVAFDIEAKEAGDMMAKWRTAFKMNQGQVNELADKINYLGNTTAASAPKISDVVRRIGPLGDIGGVASGEIAALGASMVGAGIESEVSATGIKNLILTMSSGVAATKKQAEAFEALGFNSSDVAKRMQIDAKGTIMQVLTAIKGLDKEYQSAMLKELFGSESLSAIAPLLSNLDNLQENFNKVGNKTQYAGSMQDEYNTRIQTTEAKLQLAKNAATAAGISVGNVLLPAVQLAANGFSEVSNFIGAFMDKYPGLANVATGIVAGVLAVNVAFFAFRYAINAVVLPFKSLNLAYRSYNAYMATGNGLKIKSTILTARQAVVTATSTAATKIAAGAQWAMNAAMNANPIGLVVVAVAGLIAAGWALYKNWDTVSAYTCKGWDLIENAASKVWSFFVNFCASIPQYAAYAVGAIIGFFMSIPERLQSAFDSTDGVGEAFVTKASEWGSRAYNSVISWFKNLPSALSNYVTQTWDGMKSNFTAGYAAGSGKPIAQNAFGGIYGRGAFLTTFAENSGESAIPHIPNKRNVSLLAKTNEIMGNPLGKGAGVNLQYSPTIQVSGNADVGQLQAVLDQQKIEFERMIKDFFAQRERVSYV